MPYEQIRKVFEFPFELRPYQFERVNQHAPCHLAGFYWEAGCVDADTEYLSPTGWRRIAEYAAGPVAQFDPATHRATFADPLEVVKAPCKEMIRLKTTYGLDQKLSDEHRVLLFRGDRPHRQEVTTAAALLAEHDRVLGKVAAEGRRKGHIPFQHSTICTTFHAPGGTGIPLTDAQLRLQVAVIADGYFGSRTERCVVRLKKSRKVTRLRELLCAAGVEFSERPQDVPTALGFTIFTFLAPLRVKEFGEEFWAATVEQLQVVADEVTHWDGRTLPNNRGASFSSVSKASADFVQYAWTAAGSTARISEDRRPGKYTGGVCYQVIRRGGVRGGGKGLLHLHNKASATMWREPTPDGFKYCFTVPTGFLVLRRNGCVFVTGNSGKTAGVTHWALYRSQVGDADQWILLVPPILLTQWERWLRSVKDAQTGAPLDVAVYRGTPAQRMKVNLDAEFIVTSYGVFKNDYERLYSHLEYRRVGVICDEAEALKNIQSQTHKAVKHFAEGRALALLSGTPLTTPADAYAYCRLLAPGVYKTLRQFERLHVEEKDERDKVTAWRNLDVLEANMRVNSTRVIRREVQAQLPTLTITPIVYDLHPDHEKLYKRIAEERLVEFEDGREIDAISVQALYSALQQVIVNWGEFADDDTLRPGALELVEEVLAELGPEKKLVVVANFIRSNRYLLKTLHPYGAVAVYGEVSPANKQAAIRRFIEDATCRVILLQPQAAGRGVDGLQHVCSDMLFLEAPTVPPPFHQTVARIDRDGQTNPVHCRVAMANRTVQMRMFKKLLDSDELVNSVQGGYKDLKEAVFGR